MYYIPRESNTKANLLSKLASTKKTGNLKTVIQETLQTTTIETKDVMGWEEEEPNWMTPLQEFPNSGGVAIRREWSPTLETEGQLLRHPWWRAIQKRVDSSLVQVPEQPTGRLCHERTPWRNLRFPYRGTIPCNKGGVCWLLLANTQGRHPWLHKEMQMMPRVCKHSVHPS